MRVLAHIVAVIAQKLVRSCKPQEALLVLDDAVDSAVPENMVEMNVVSIDNG
jgi:hypothetical protein